MKAGTKLYWKTFLRSGMIYGFVLAIWEYLDEGEFDFLKLGFMTVFFGALMSWTTVTAHKRATKAKE